jgi:hypothetical protein
MIIGGHSGSGLLDTVELFNWKTHQQCELPAKLPLTVSEHSGAVMSGQGSILQNSISAENFYVG